MNRILGEPLRDRQGTTTGTSACGTTSELHGQYRPPAALRDLRPEKPRPEARLRADAAAALARRQLQPVLGLRQPVAVRRARAGSIVITAGARGPDGWYYDHAGADVFEVWADVARRYPLDPDWTAITGYSMGGYGTYKLAPSSPTCSRRAADRRRPAGPGHLGAPGSSRRRVEHERDARLAAQHPIPDLERRRRAGPDRVTTDRAGAARRSRATATSSTCSPAADHFALAIHDQYAPAAEFLGERREVRNPAHVTYVPQPDDGLPRPRHGRRSRLLARDCIARRLGRDAARQGRRALGGFGEGDPEPRLTGGGRRHARPGRAGRDPVQAPLEGVGGRAGDRRARRPDAGRGQPRPGPRPCRAGAALLPPPARSTPTAR